MLSGPCEVNATVASDVAAECFLAETNALIACAKRVASIIVESDDPAVLKAEIPPIVTRAEGHLERTDAILTDGRHDGRY